MNVSAAVDTVWLGFVTVVEVNQGAMSAADNLSVGTPLLLT